MVIGVKFVDYEVIKCVLMEESNLKKETIQSLKEMFSRVIASNVKLTQ